MSGSIEHADANRRGMRSASGPSRAARATALALANGQSVAVRRARIPRDGR
jgi:hypothetical protein